MYQAPLGYLSGIVKKRPPLATSIALVNSESDSESVEKTVEFALAYPKSVIVCQISSRVASAQVLFAEGPEHKGRTSLGKSSALARYPFLSAASLFPCVDPSLPVIFHINSRA